MSSLGNKSSSRNSSAVTPMAAPKVQTMEKSLSDGAPVLPSSSARAGGGAASHAEWRHRGEMPGKAQRSGNSVRSRAGRDWRRLRAATAAERRWRSGARWAPRAACPAGAGSPPGRGRRGGAAGVRRQTVRAIRPVSADPHPRAGKARPPSARRASHSTPRPSPRVTGRAAPAASRRRTEP
jgi:hypothetical protein